MRLFDLHCDTFTELYDHSCDLCDRRLAVNDNELSCFETAIQTFAVFLRPREVSAQRYQNVLQNGKRCLKKAGIKTVTSAEGLKTGGRKKALLSVEGGVPGFDPHFVERLYRDGIRTVSLTWNDDNPLAGGALGQGELTDLGVAVIKALDRYNMVADLSHLNRKSFYQAAEAANIIAATHTGVDALVPHPRNLTDDQLKVIKERKGLVGLCIYPEFIGRDPFEGFYKAAVHCLALGLEDNIALGTDLDGAEMQNNLSKTSHLRALYRFLLDKGIEKRLCDKIFFENSYNFYNRVLTKREI